jgi:hypothetical protein
MWAAVRVAGRRYRYLDVSQRDSGSALLGGDNLQ